MQIFLSFFLILILPSSIIFITFVENFGTMKITVLQTDIEWGLAEANRFRLEALMASMTPTDLVVMPEMFTTGFDMKPAAMAEPADGDTLQWMRRMAEKYDCAVAGSIAVSDTAAGDSATHAPRKYFNRLYFVKPDGTEAHYDKHHLFSFGGEDRQYAAGTHRTVVEWRGMRWLLLVCYDVRFPAWIRYRGDYDGIVLVANWPTGRISAWDTLVRARAIENQCYVVAANRVGHDPVCAYNGHSAILDAYGHALAEAPEGEEALLTADIDLPSLQTFRHKFPVLCERDEKIIGPIPRNS
jgi:predicted amidohydrolase